MLLCCPPTKPTDKQTNKHKCPCIHTHTTYAHKWTIYTTYKLILWIIKAGTSKQQAINDGLVCMCMRVCECVCACVCVCIFLYKSFSWPAGQDGIRTGGINDAGFKEGSGNELDWRKEVYSKFSENASGGMSAGKSCLGISSRLRI